MSVIIRLQNLPWTANALDIRRFFGGLHIPDGGVHIVGGEKGDAFIAFATDDDARQAMLMDGGRLSDCNIKLYLSSKTEMQNVINVARGGSGPTQAGEDNSTYGRANVGTSSSALGGHGSLLGPQSGYGNMAGDFGNQSRQNQGSFTSAGSSSQYGRSNDGMLGNFGEGRQQGRMGGFGSASQNTTGSNQNFQQAQGSWDRPMQQGLPASGGEYGGSLAGQQQQQQGHMSGFGVRDIGFSGRDGNRENSFNSLNQYPSNIDIGRQTSNNFAESNLGDGVSGFNRDNSSVGGNLTGSVGNIGQGFNNMARDNQKGDSFMERPTEENIFLQPRDQVRAPTGNIFLQGRDQNRPASSVNAFSSVTSRSFNADSNQGGGRFQDSARGRFSENSSNNRFHDNGNRGFKEGKSSFAGQDLNSQRGFQERAGLGFDNRSGFKDSRGSFSAENRTNFAEGRGNFGTDSRQNFGVDSRTDDRRGGRRDSDVHVLITDMPIKTSYRDIRRFFGNSSEIIRDGVKLINDKFGQRIGKAYVKFASEHDCRNAVRRNSDLMDGKRVGIQRCSVAEYDKAVDSFQPPPEARRPIERREISREGRNFELVAPSTKRERIPSPKSHDSVQKSKPKEEPKTKPFVKKEKEMPKSRKNEVSKASADVAPSSSPIKRAARSRSRSPPKKKQAIESGENCCILLKNLPFKAQKHDIRKFFGHLKISARGGPYFEVRNDGKHTGTAFVQFETAKEAKDAMRNDGKPLNGRSVEMVPISKREFEENVSALRSGTPEPDEKVEEQNGDGKIEGDMKFYCIKMKGLPYSANNQSVREFFEGLEIANRGIHIVYNSQRQAAGTAFVEFVTARDCKKAQEKHKGNMGKRYILIEPITKKEMLEQLQKEQQRQRDQGPRAPPSLMESINFLSNLGTFGGNINSGSTSSNMNRGSMAGGDRTGRFNPVMVQLQNLPFKANESDILSFFRGYGPVRSSLKIDQRDGKPTGKAVVGFHNMEQQSRAMNELNKKHLMGRPIHIHVLDRY